VSILFAVAFSKQVARNSTESIALISIQSTFENRAAFIRERYRSAAFHLRARHAPASSAAIEVKEFASAAPHLTVKPAGMEHKSTRGKL
jgi:hypothetical protein